MRVKSISRDLVHLDLGIHFQIIGAKETQLGKCFVVRGMENPRERMFLVDKFDIPCVERDAVYLTLVDLERRRVANREAKQRSQERRKRDEEYDADRAADDEPDGDEQKINLWGYEPTDPEPVEDNAEFETISAEDSCGEESLPEETQDEETETDEELAAD